jgi:hypothetical protein
MLSHVTVTIQQTASAGKDTGQQAGQQAQNKEGQGQTTTNELINSE